MLESVLGFAAVLSGASGHIACRLRRRVTRSRIDTVMFQDEALRIHAVWKTGLQVVESRVVWVEVRECSSSSPTQAESGWGAPLFGDSPPVKKERGTRRGRGEGAHRRRRKKIVG